MTDTVAAKLAEWEARLSTERALRKGDPYYSAEAGAWDRDSVDLDRFTALLGFVREVLTLIDEDHCPGGCEHDAIDAEVLGDRIKRALMEQIGGEG
jgi:hypothetical protein